MLLSKRPPLTGFSSNFDPLGPILSFPFPFPWLFLPSFFVVSFAFRGCMMVHAFPQTPAFNGEVRFFCEAHGLSNKNVRHGMVSPCMNATTGE